MGITDPGLLPFEAGHSQHQVKERREAPVTGLPYTTQALGNPTLCLGSLAVGQPCAEAMERDVPLAERGMRHWALRQTVPPKYHHEAWRGLESEAEGQPA